MQDGRTRIVRYPGRCTDVRHVVEKESSTQKETALSSAEASGWLIIISTYSRPLMSEHATIMAMLYHLLKLESLNKEHSAADIR